MRLVPAILALILSTLGLAGNAEATVIASTAFTGRTVTANTASNFAWTFNGIADPGNLTASHNLFNTPNAQNLFAVDRNLRNEGPWTVDIALDVGSAALKLSLVTLDAYIFNDAGTFQTTSRDLDLKIDLLKLGPPTTLATKSVNNIYPNSGSASQPKPVEFDLSGNTLAANTGYILRLTASKDSTFGNNAGIDNLVINGVITPEPTAITIWGLGLLAMCGYGWRRRRA